VKRALTAAPVGVLVWYALGFGPWYLESGELLPSVPSALDAVVLGALVGGLLAGMVVRRLQVAVPVVLLAAGGLCWSTDVPRWVLVTMLMATGAATVFGAVSSYRSVLAAIGLTLPVASYVVLPGRDWLGDRTAMFDGLLVAVGFTMLLYVACWHNGWRALTWWPVVTGAYLSSFALITALDRGAAAYRPGDPDGVADAAMDGFVQAFRPFVETNWPWLAVAVFLAVMTAALKIRVLPPVTPQPRSDLLDDRGNDAYLPDDLGWFEYEEPKRLLDRIPRRREPVG
jgi:hypothetical protein